MKRHAYSTRRASVRARARHRARRDAGVIVIRASSDTFSDTLLPAGRRVLLQCAEQPHVVVDLLLGSPEGPVVMAGGRERSQVGGICLHDLPAARNGLRELA